jgi:hypothetical protein
MLSTARKKRAERLLHWKQDGDQLQRWGWPLQPNEIEMGSWARLSDSVWCPLPHNSTPDQQDDYCSDDSAD